MAIIQTSSYGTISREELQQTREDMAFIANYLRNMTEEEKEAYRKNPNAGMKRITLLAAKKRKSTHKAPQIS
ncbi:MAG: hypothetical protein E7030_00760 [Akkermansiaceae bacterium]|nr:hypothetical protein [Akkermansiaceae bacterium]